MSKKSALLLALVLMASLAVAQEVGDYRSAGNGLWAVNATWETWDGSNWNPATTAPAATNNVLVRSGHTVTVGGSPYACRNLVVQSGAVLYCNTTTGRYINLNGDSVRCDGTIGSSTDGLSFTCMTSITFAGNGTYQVNRLRPGANNVSIVIDRNFELHYPAAAPNNVALYFNGNSGCTIQVNAADTLTFSGTAAFACATNSSTASSYGGTFYIDGTVIMPSGSNFNISVANGVSSMLQVYGNLVLGDSLIADAATSGDETVVVHGAINYASADTQKFDNLYTNNPAGTSFGFPVRVNGILYVGYGDYDNSSGLSMAYGAHIYRHVGALTAAPDFDRRINLQYGPNPENQPLTTGHEVPLSDSIFSVTFDNAAGVVLDRVVECYNSVVLDEGIVTTGDHMLACHNQPARSAGYVEGMLGIWIPTGYPTVTYHVGTANGYSPVNIYFLNVFNTGGVGVRAVQSTHPDVNIAANTMQRYWDIGQHPVTPVVFDSCRIFFTYLPADFNTGFLEPGDEGTMVVGRYDDPDWNFPAIDSRNMGGVDDGGTISIANITSFSDFTMGKDQNSIAYTNVGPTITLVAQPSDTYDGAGPFLVRAVITDPGKSLVADTLWYTDNTTNWWWLTHTNVTGDTFSYSIPGPLDPGTVIEYFIGAWDDGGAVQYAPGMYRGYQFRILDPLPPTGLAATPGDHQVFLEWAPPAEVLEYFNNNSTLITLQAGDIADTRFTPQHYPCKVEQVVSSWYYAIGADSVEVHVWADDGYGLPDRSTELIPPRVVMPLDYPNYTVIDISSDNLILSSGDFHVGYVTRSTEMPKPTCDGNGPGIRSMVYNSSAGTWGNLIINGTEYCDWVHRAAVSYSSYFKDQEPGKSLVETYHVFRSDVGGGPYDLLGNANGLAYTDNAVIGGNTYYYVVRSQYISPDTFSVYSNEASATPTGVTGDPGTKIPTVFSLANNYPNPVRSNTTIKFGLPKESQVRVEVYNIAGQRVKTLASDKLNAGYHQVSWKGANEAGQKVAAGVYLVRMVTPEFNATRKMTVIR